MFSRNEPCQFKPKPKQSLADISVISVGVTSTVDPSLETHIIKENDSVYEKLVFKGNRLIGFILLGKIDKAGVLTA